MKYLPGKYVSKSPLNCCVSYGSSKLSLIYVFLFLHKSIQNYLWDLRYYITAVCSLLCSFTVWVKNSVQLKVEYFKCILKSYWFVWKSLRNIFNYRFSISVGFTVDFYLCDRYNYLSHTKTTSMTGHFWGSLMVCVCHLPLLCRIKLSKWHEKYSSPVSKILLSVVSLSV